jgi:hypothetical protein
MESAQQPYPAPNKQTRVRQWQTIASAIGLALAVGLPSAHGTQEITIAWDPSVTPGVAGYILYYGTNSGTYVDSVLAGLNTTVTVTGLVDGVTYYFAATAYNDEWLESDPSEELPYLVPDANSGDLPPTLNPIFDVTLGPNSELYTVVLTGISDPSTNQHQALRITATSSNPYLVATPIVTYSSLNATGTLTFSSLANLTGSATIAVTVDNGQAQNNAVTRTFTVVVESPSQNNGSEAKSLLLEAEAGILSSPMTIAADPEASNGRYIYSSRSELGAVTIRFNVAEADDYLVWCRVLSVDAGADSFYMSIDGGPEEIYRTTPNSWSSQWQWTRVNDEGTATPRRFGLGVGSHTLTFRSREASTLLDAVYVTNDPDFVPLRLALAPVTSPVRGMQITFQSSPGYRYQLQATEDFRSWVTIWSTPLAVSNQLFKFVDPISAATRARFYRVRFNSTNQPDVLALALPLDLTIGPAVNPVRGMRISFQSTIGFQYQVQATEDFRAWVPVWNSPVAIANETLSVVDTASTIRRARFYRIQINPPSQFASASTPLKLVVAREPDSTRVRVSFQAVAGRQYQLQATEDFRSWTPIWNSPAGSGNQTLSYVDGTDRGLRARFYRVQSN